MNMQKTYMHKSAEVTRKWHVMDAQNQVLGRFAVLVAKQLIGKGKREYTPHVDGGDYVIIVNAGEIAVTGNKATDKKYYRHSNYPGGFKEISFEKLLVRKPEEVLKLAVYNMLPKNKLRTDRMNRLKIYASTEHPHQSQVGEIKE